MVRSASAPDKRRVFVYLPLEGENEDDDENNERAEKRAQGHASMRGGRHRSLTLHAVARFVKSNRPLFVEVVLPIRQTAKS